MICRRRNLLMVTLACHLQIRKIATCQTGTCHCHLSWQDCGAQGLRGPGVQGSGGQLPSFNVPAKTVAPAVDCNCRCCSYYAINEIWPATNWASPGSSRWAGLFPEQSENMKVEIGYGQARGLLLTNLKYKDG